MMQFPLYSKTLLSGLAVCCAISASGCAAGNAGQRSGEKPFVDADKAASLLAEARAEFDAGSADDAEQSLLLAVDANPFDGRLHYNLGVLALRRGAYETAVSRFERATELMPQAVEPQLGIASTLLQTGRFESAAEAFNRALELDPANAVALRGLAIAIDQSDPLESRRTNR
ncbi:MAG: tetratricopeptide repeat protein [Phycisphaerales bacterium JB065]